MTSPTTDLPLATLQAWLATHAADFGPNDPLEAKRLPAGQSNPTWLLNSGARRWVLRAKPGPASSLLPSAHAIEREVKVMRALAASDVPVPKVQVLCEDESVIGAAFYVMDFVDGRIVRDTALPDDSVATRAALHREAVRTLAALHRVDWTAAGLADFGRHEGFYDRMIGRWTKQYRATETEKIPAMESLIEWLPVQADKFAAFNQDITIVHGDFRLENLVFSHEGDRVLAVLDWELSTLGHPLADLAYHCMAWHHPQGILRGMQGLDFGALGIPTETQVIRDYCALVGREDADAVMLRWPFYLACNCFRLAAILQGIAHRVKQGIASSPQAVDIAQMARPVAETGWRIASAQA